MHTVTHGLGQDRSLKVSTIPQALRNTYRAHEDTMDESSLPTFCNRVLKLAVFPRKSPGAHTEVAARPKHVTPPTILAGLYGNAGIYVCCRRGDNGGDADKQLATSKAWDTVKYDGVRTCMCTETTLPKQWMGLVYILYVYTVRDKWSIEPCSHRNQLYANSNNVVCGIASAITAHNLGGSECNNKVHTS